MVRQTRDLNTVMFVARPPYVIVVKSKRKESITVHYLCYKKSLVVWDPRCYLLPSRGDFAAFTLAEAELDLATPGDGLT